MTKARSRMINGALLAAGIAIGGWVVHPFVPARGSIRVPKPATVGGATLSGVQKAWRELDGRVVPPLGTSSAVPWKGVDFAGQAREVPPFSCFESVNYLTTGDATKCAYRSWPSEDLTNLDESATWDALEESLKTGDVVEFVAKVRINGGTTTTSPFHAQLCVAEGGLMAGANNEPRFRLVNGVPSGTNVWNVCTSRQYYLAARDMDAMWAAYGNEHTYRVVVYRHPE